MIDGRVVAAIRAGLALALVVLAAAPESWLEGGPSLCLVRALAGRECPGCGMTRAASALLHGDFGRAMVLNEGVVFVLPLVAGLVVFGGLLVQGDSKCKR